MTETTQLHAYADGEMPPAEANALRETLKSDPQAAAEVDAVLNLKDFLARHATRQPEEEAWKTCVRRLDSIDKTRRVEGFVGRYAWAICGALFLFIVSGRAAMRNVEGDTALTADVTRIFRPARPATDWQRDQSKLYGEILGDVGRSLDPKGVDIGEAVYGQVHDLPAVRVPMRDRGGDFILTKIKGLMNLQDTAPTSANPRMSYGVADGENCLVWHTNGTTWVLSGHRSLSDLVELSGRLFILR